MQSLKVTTLLVALIPAAFAMHAEKSFLGGKLNIHATQASRTAKGYGPNECVKVDRSEAGTCVLRTACAANVDLEKTEFAFLCVLKDGEVQKHSYGEGGFGSEETFDSSVSCEQCLLPTMALSLEKSTAVESDEDEEDDAKEEANGDEKKDEKKAEKKDEAKDDKKKDAEKKDEKKPEGLPIDLHHNDLKGGDEKKREEYLKGVFAKHPNATSNKDANGTLKATSKYGPDGCISTYVSPKNTCMMKTECKKQAEEGKLKDYDFGLTCVEGSGKSVRHLFGTNSFDPEETFDTLIDCKLCIGLDAKNLEEKKEGLSAKVATLKEEVKKLSDGMKEIEGDVEKLNEKVGIGKKEEKKEEKNDDKKQEKKEGDSFMLHKVVKTDADEVQKVEKVEKKDEAEVTEDDAEVADDSEEEEAPPAPVHKKHHKKHHRHLVHKKAKKARHHHKHHKKAHHKKHHDVEEEEASDDATEAPVSDDSEAAPKPAVDDSEQADAAGEDEDADGW